MKHLFGRLAIALWRGNATLWLRRAPALHPSADGVIVYFHIFIFLHPFARLTLRTTYSLAIDRARALLGSIARCARTPRPREYARNFHDQDRVVKKRREWREVLVMVVMAVYTRL